MSLRRIDIKEREGSIKNESEKTTVSKIQALGDLLESITVDEEGTIFASEPKIKPVFNSEQQEIIKNKIIELIKKL